MDLHNCIYKYKNIKIYRRKKSLRRKVKIYPKLIMNELNQSTNADSVNSIENNQDILRDYADIRWQMATLEAKLREIEPMAVKQALDIVSQGEAANAKRVVYRTDTVDIVLQLRTHKPNPQDHPDLETLKEFINLETEKAFQLNRDAIAKLEREIAVLEASLVGLKQTDDGLEYVAQYEELVTQLTTQKPILSVKLK